MAQINQMFKRIEKLLNTENNPEFVISVLKNDQNTSCKNVFKLLKEFLEKMIGEIDNLSNEIKQDSTVLISISNEKLLRTCFELIVSLGSSQCLIPGLGISLTKRSMSTKDLHITLNHEEKYDILVKCTDFFIRSYDIPFLKNILVRFHLCDYLASLIQLSFAPLKKPGIYEDYTMTEEIYQKLNEDKNKYTQKYENLVTNCHQPTLMKELLMLQNVTYKTTPAFVRRVVAKEMSRRLIAPGGLLSMIQCFFQSYDEDTGHDWKKIEMICKIVATKHGDCDQDAYLYNITQQMRQILLFNNVEYLATVITCLLKLNEKYPKSESVSNLKREVTQCLDIDVLLLQSIFPGTLLLTPLEVENKINILHCILCVVEYEWDATILANNLYVLNLLGMSCTDADTKVKLTNMILKCFELVDQDRMRIVMESLLFGYRTSKSPFIAIEKYVAGLAIKCVSDSKHPKNKATLYFIELFNAVSNSNVAQKLIESCLEIFLSLDPINLGIGCNESLFTLEDDMELEIAEENLFNVIQLISEIASSQVASAALSANPLIIINFVETLMLRASPDSNEEYMTIGLVLLNTIFSKPINSTEVEQKLHNLVPALEKIVKNGSKYNAIISKEILSHILSEYSKKTDSAYEKAMSDVFDTLLPVRAHGIIELTKLIDAHDEETLSKRHYIICLLQEHLKNPDSYIYLSAINGIAALSTHCTEDVLITLCKEFLQVSKKQDEITTENHANNITELRMKVGDILVKVTRRLGEMAIVHKSTLLNTMLCGCRDHDPLIRTSALSNLAEIALVLHYKMGSIISEVLFCIWSMIESDKAIDCRRAAVMVISSLLKGLGNDTLIELKENLLPIYKTLRKLYKDDSEDSVVRLHSQIALEELNSIVSDYIFSPIRMEKKIVLSESKDIIYK